MSPEGSVVITPSMTTRQIGAVVTLTCAAEGGPGNTFTWTRQPAGAMLGSGESLNVSLTTARDGGVLECNVTNSAGYAVMQSTINGNPLEVSKPVTLLVSCDNSRDGILHFSLLFLINYTTKSDITYKNIQKL